MAKVTIKANKKENVKGLKKNEEIVDDVLELEDDLLEDDDLELEEDFEDIEEDEEIMDGEFEDGDDLDGDLLEDDLEEEEVKPVKKETKTSKKEEIVEEEDEEFEDDLQLDEVELEDDLEEDLEEVELEEEIEEDKPVKKQNKTSKKEEIVEEEDEEFEEEILDDLEEEEDDLEEVELEEEVEEDKPVKKSTKSKDPVKVKKETVKETKKESKPDKKATSKTTTKTKKDSKSKGIKKVRKTRTYEEFLQAIKTEKVDMYNKIMKERAEGKTNAIPPIKRASRDNFVRLVTLKLNEDNSSFKKAAASVSLVKADEIDKNIPLARTAELIDEIFDVIYDLLKIESGIDMFKKDDLIFSIQGRNVEPSVMDLTRINKGAVKIGKHLKVDCKSVPPAELKVQGTIKKGKFVPNK